jgi:UDP-GlcNAc:undecaprenyl-phosphate GlcNAc-1-phosphate transferase
VPVLAALAVAVWFLLRPTSAGPLELAGAAFLAAYALTPAARLMAIGAGALDHPDARKTHVAPTPKLGGVAIIAALILVVGRRALIDPEIQAIVVAALVLMVAGAVDDLRGLSSRWRLLLQIGGAAGVMAAGVRLHLVPGPLGGYVDGFLTILWIVGITNAYNFIDGMDGLAGSLGALLAGFLAVAAAQGGSAAHLPIAAALTGALLGFLPHNLRTRGRRAVIFLGDSGSASVGFMLAALAIAQDWATRDPLVALAAPVLIFSVLIHDMVQTTIARIGSGRVRSVRAWLDYTGRDHIHHRLTEVLGGERRALALILTLGVALGSSAMGLRAASRRDALLFLLHGALVLLVVEILLGAPRRSGTGVHDGGAPAGPRDEFGLVAGRGRAA